jgi:6-phosphogluconate dehydrogenase (decarboxylating)
MSTPDIPLAALLFGSAPPAADLAARFVRAGLAIGIYDENAAAAEQLARNVGMRRLTSVSELRDTLVAPRAVWLSSAGAGILRELENVLEKADVIADVSEGDIRDASLRARALAARGIGYADITLAAGTWSGNIGRVLAVGVEEGYANTLSSQFDALAQPPEGLWALCGPPGSARFVSAVEREMRKGITCAMTEGLELYGRGGFRLQPGDLARMWQRGSAVNAALGQLAAEFLDVAGWTNGAPGKGALPGVPPAVALALSLRFAAQGAELYLQQIAGLMAAASATREPGADA